MHKLVRTSKKSEIFLHILSEVSKFNRKISEYFFAKVPLSQNPDLSYVYKQFSINSLGQS